MSIISTKAIVISSIKYSDTSLIVKLFTQEKGVQSFLLKGILSSKKGAIKPGYFLPLTQLKIVANIRENKNLQSLKEVSVSHHYLSISNHIIKQSIALFLSEILAQSIQEHEKNNELFEFLESSFTWLDRHEKVSGFHLLFLIKLTKYLGFYPDTTDISFKGFNLLEGNFTNSTNENNILKGQKLIVFKKLLAIHFEDLDRISFSKTERKDLLNFLTHYFELHLEGFRNPRSLSVLESVFA